MTVLVCVRTLLEVSTDHVCVKYGASGYSLAITSIQLPAFKVVKSKLLKELQVHRGHDF